MRATALGLFVAAVASAAAGPQPPERPVFPSGTEVVLLDLVVRDGRGRLVTDLDPSEVEVREDGRVCELKSFRLVQDGVERRAARSSTDVTEGPAAASPPAEPSTTGARLRSVVLLVFDQLGLESAIAARRAALEFASRPFPPGTVFGVFKVGEGSLRILQPFTEDPQRLPAAIEAATVGGDSPRDSPVRPGFTSATEEAFAAAEQSGRGGGSFADAAFAAANARLLRLADLARREQRGRSTLHPLLAMVTELATVRGRKTLVLLSEGLHVPPDVGEVFRATLSQANRANVTVYTLDPRGLVVDSPFKEAKMALGVAAGAQAESRSGEVNLESVKGPDTLLDGLRLNVQANLEALAEGTGGFLVQNTNDLGAGIEGIGSDLRNYYELAYVPSNPSPDGRFRRIEVVVRRPGVRVRTREGYYALPPGAPTVLPSELPLAAALQAVTPPRDFEHRGAALALAPVKGETPTVLFVEVPLSGIHLHSDAATGLYTGQVAVLGVVRDAKGEMAARLAHTWDLRGPASEVASVARGRLLLRRSLPLSPGRYVLESAVQDRPGGRLSVRRTAFVVPAAVSGLTLGDVAVVKLQPTGEAPEPDPLQVGSVRAVPALGEAFAEGTEEVDVFWSAHATGDVPLRIGLELRRDGEVVGWAAPVLPRPDDSGRVSQINRMAAGALRPGRYQVWIKATQGDAEAVAATSFEIVPRAPSHSAVDAAAAPAPGSGVPAAPGPVPAVPPEVASLLEVAGAYVEEYEAEFKNLVAEETYRQWVGVGGSPRVRNLRSDLVFVGLPGDIPWTTFRDVYEVDGQKVRDRDARLERLFLRPPGDAVEQANRIMRESARYNFGPADRTINVPTLALLFLHPRNHGRFAWERKGRQGEGVEVRFREVARPSLVRQNDDGDLPARGRFVIDPERGTVLRSEVEFAFEPNRALATLKVDFAPAPDLDILVPAVMREFYVDEPNAAPPEFGARIECVARYSKYRRFGVRTEEVVDLPEPPP